MASSEQRGNARRGATTFGDETGYDIPNHAAPSRGKRWPAPSDIYAINRYTRQRAASGRCVVCSATTTAPGVTCKDPSCVSCWVLGHEE